MIRRTRSKANHPRGVLGSVQGRRRARRLSSVILAGALAGACAEPPPPAEPALRSVRTVIVESASGDRSRTFSGTSRSTQQSRLSFKVSGTLVDVPIEVGDRLDRGQLIARVDPSQYELEAQQAQANLVQAQAGERSALSAYDRTRGLYENNSASRGDLDTARANSESAKAQVGAAQKQLELARLNVSYTRLRAAVDCSVASVDVEVNENIQAGSTVAMVNCGNDLEVLISIPESLIAGLERGMEAEIRFDALPEQTFTGEISEIGVASGGSATFPVTVSLDRPPSSETPQPRSGLAAEVTFRFPGNPGETSFLVPLSTVVNSPAGPFVYLAKPVEGGEGIVERRAVELGELTEEGVQILTGLEPGERVITAGTSAIRDGLRVRLPETTPVTESD